MATTTQTRSSTTLKRWALRVAVVLVALLAVLIVGAWAALRLVDLEAITARVEAVVTEATGRKFAIGATPEVTLLPQPRVVIRDITLANPPGASRPHALVVPRVAAGFSVAGLLTGRGLGARVEVSEPEVLIERDDKGNWNWDLVGSVRDLLRELVQALGVVAQYARFDTLAISDGRVELRDQPGSVRTLTVTRAEGVVAAEVLEVTLDAALDGHTLGARGSIGVRDFDRAALPLQLKLNVPGAEASASGKVRAAWPSDGTDVQVDIRVDDARRLGEAAGFAAPRLPAVVLSARLVGRDGALRAEPLDLSMAASRMSGFVELRDRKPRPAVNAKLNAPVIDLSQVEAKPSGVQRDEATAAADGRVIPDAALEFAGLRRFDGRLDLTVKRLVLPKGAALENVAAKLALAGGRLVADPMAVSAGKNRLKAALTIDASSPRSTAVTAALRAQGVTLASLIDWLPKGFRISGGSTDIDIGVTGNGESLRPLLASLKGHVRVDLRDATASGALAALGGSVLGQALGTFDPYAKADDSSKLKCLVVNVPVRGGVLSTKQGIGVETDRLVGVVSGRIDLGNETLDVNLRSESVGRALPGLADFASAGRLTGSFAQPQIALDARGAAELSVSTGAAVATGGATLVLGPLLRAAIPAQPCKVAREATKADE